MKQIMTAALTLACLALGAPMAEAGEGRWNAVQGWLKKLPPDASHSRTVQLGNGNGSSTVQLGGGNVSVIYQKGSGNNAQVNQTGRGNVSSIIQLGDANTAITEQNGNGNVSSQVQIGSGHFAQTRQSGGRVSSHVQTSGGQRSKQLKRLDKAAWRNVKDAVKDYRRR